jgi:glycine cleavage system regulatory protein
VLVDMGSGKPEALRAAVAAVDEVGLEVRIAPAGERAEAAGETLQFSLVGQDRPGIVNQVTAALSPLGANIETFETWLSKESHSGAALFNMAANLRLPPGLSAARVQAALEAISGEIMVDVAVG